jgi:hypothetical protein
MHAYSGDPKERADIIFRIALLSIFAAWGLHRGLELTQIAIPWWLDAPSTLMLFGLFYRVFDGWMWRTWFVKWLKLSRTPDLNGIWSGYVISSFDEHGPRHDASIRIYQSWTQMRITLEAPDSVSQSLAASLLREDPEAIVLSYEYLNEPRAYAIETMHAHRGTARLNFRKIAATDVLEGEYYTGRDRRNFGVLSFQRVSLNPQAR